METQTPNPTAGETRDAASTSQPNTHQEFHSFLELPVSVAHVSRGPLGGVARQDHTSWKNKELTDPTYWSGWIDYKLGDSVQVQPIRKIALCFGIGALLGMIFRSRAH